jgi:hypothetical protein
MKFLILAYGAEEDWNRLTAKAQDALLAQDEVMRRRGDTLAALRDEPTVVRAPDGAPIVTAGAFARSAVPLAGFGIVEADSLDEVIRLVKDTPCARAGGAVEIRPILALDG